MADRITGRLARLDQALALIPEWDAGRARLLATRADILRGHADRTGDTGDRAAADEAMRAAYEESLRFGGDVLRLNAGNWALRAAERRDWQRAAEAGDHALRAATDLVHRQTHVDYKRAILRNGINVATTTADALRRLGRLADAVTVLDRSQTLVLAEQFLLPHEVEAQLRRTAGGELADTYRELVADTLRIDAPDAELRQAMTRLADFQQSLTDETGAPLVLATTTADPIATLSGTVTAYLAPGFALVVRESGALVDVDLPELTPAAIAEIAHAVTSRVMPAGAGELTRMLAIQRTCAWATRIILEPLAAALGDSERVTLVPTGQLAGLPLHAVADRAVGFLPSAALAARGFGTVTPASHAVVVADPNRPDSPALPGTRQEAETIEKTFASTTTFSDDTADATNVRGALPDAELVHFGCHGVSDPHSPLDSALLLSGQQELRLRDLLDVPLSLRQAQLVVLSACQTSSVDEQLPTESLNLSTGMIAAGARAAIGSLWPVPDESSAAVMTAFYRELASGQHPQQALHHAQRTVASQPDREHPFYWAGFVYIGV